MKSSLKSIALLMPFLLASFSVFTQNISVSCFGKDQPAFVRIIDGENVQQLIVPDWKENPVVRVEGQDATHYVDLGFLREENQLPPADYQDQMFEYIEPGLPVEGDMPSDGEYSKDGSIFAYIHQLSDNVIFYDANTYEILAVVQVPRQPVDLKMGEDHAYVCCHSARGLVEISLDDFSVSNWVPVDGTPCQVEVSPGDDTAYVACDSYGDGWIIAVDLNTNQVIYESYNPWIHNFGVTYARGRTQHQRTKFWLSPDGNKFVAGDTTTRPTIFNAYTGLAEKTFDNGGVRSAGFSPSGDTIYLYSERGDSLLMYRINTADNSVIDSIKAAADIFYIVFFSDLAINHDGSRVIVGDAWNGNFYLFNFNDYSCQSIDAILDPDTPIFSSSDGEYAVAPAYLEVDFVNFESGQIFDTWNTGIRPGWPLCVSTVENRLMVGNGPYHKKNEILYSVNFEDINNIFSDTTLLCGEAPEADAPACAVIWDEGKADPAKILSANSLSHNLSFIGINDHIVDTVIHFDEMSGVKIVPGSDIAIVYGGSANKTWILSLANYEILKILSVGEIMDVFVTSDGQTGYLIMNMGTNVRIIKINIDGASTTILHQQMVGGNHCDWTMDDGSLNTTSAFSPDEQLLLFGYDDPELGPVINIVDAETLDLLTSVPVPENCIYDFVFTDDSKRVIALGYNPVVPIIYLDRENSFLENYIEINNNSFSGCYNPVDSSFYVLEQNNFIYKVDPLTGEILRYFNTCNEYNCKIAIDQRGMPMVLTTTSMIYDGETYLMPGPSSFLTYDREHDLFISPVPGPDVICVFNPLQTGIQQFKPGQDDEVTLFPNPATDQIIIRSTEKIARIEVCNMAGAVVYSGNFNGKNIEIPTGNLAPGVYVIDIATDAGSYSKKIMVRN